MTQRFLVLILLLFLSYCPLQAQELSALSYLDNVIVANDAKLGGERIGGLSAVVNHPDGNYYFAADKPPSRVLRARIDYTDHLAVDFDTVCLLTPSLIRASELEGIAYNEATATYYVADEQSQGTRIMELDKSFEFMRIIQPQNKGFLPLSGHNSGIEGLTISNDEKHLFNSFERPSEDFIDERLVKITKLNISNLREEAKYFYQLHKSIADKVGTNGISEILYIDDKTLLVMERAYIPGLGNIVRLYKAYLPKVVGNSDNPGEKDDNIILESELLFDFGSTDGFLVDNAEGMTFNADRSLLIIVTDNNFSKRQQTQIIALKTKWE